MKMLNTCTAAAAATMVMLSGAAQASLVDRGGGMIYDTTRNLTWLADMNYARTSGYTSTDVLANGRMSWDAATAWADNLVYAGYSDWRLPTLNPADTTCSDSYTELGGGSTQYYGTGCTGGELSGLFVTDLGNKPHESVLNQVGDTAEQIANLALFSNVQSYAYWSGTADVLNPGYAWALLTLGNPLGGGQYGAHDYFSYYAVAVRPGDVATSVPEPQTLALAMLALGAAVVARRKRPA
jgi:MYXO-CTERM domain-containing protein